MASARRADGSSSPSADPVLVDLRSRGTRSGLFEITLSNGASFFVSERTVRDKRLGPGTQLPEREWPLLAALDERERCYAKGQALCARMEQPRAGLARKLAGRGYSAEAAESACARLAREGFLDDGRFALAWARGRLRRRREGPLLIRYGLLRKGVDRQLIEARFAAARKKDSWKKP